MLGPVRLVVAGAACVRCRQQGMGWWPAFSAGWARAFAALSHPLRDLCAAGLVAAGCTVAAGPAHLRLSLKSYPTTANTEAAVEAADPPLALT